MNSFQARALGAVAVLASLAVHAAPARAEAVYLYTGPALSNITTTGDVSGLTPRSITDHFTGTLDLSQALAPNLDGQSVAVDAFHVSDGVFDFTQATPGVGSEFDFWTDGSGNITQWLGVVTNQTPFTGGYFEDVFRIANVADGLPRNLVDASGQYLCGDGSTPNYCVSADSLVGTSDGPGAWRLEGGAAVPEPAAWMLLLLGVGGIGGLARARREAKAAA